jgi:hypothetical protein
LHRRAAQMAERDSTSLNQFLVSAVAEKVGAESFYKHMIQDLRQRLAQGARQPIINNIIVSGTTLPTTAPDISISDMYMNPLAKVNTAKSSFPIEFGEAPEGGMGGYHSPNIAIASAVGGLNAGILGYQSEGN